MPAMCVSCSRAVRSWGYYWQNYLLSHCFILVQFQVYLLEINQGPGLEGHCFPEVCQKTVDDAIDIAVKPLLNRAMGPNTGTSKI